MLFSYKDCSKNSNWNIKNVSIQFQWSINCQKSSKLLCFTQEKSKLLPYLDLVSTSTLKVFFCQIKSFIKFRLAFVFGLQTLYLIDFTKILQLKDMNPKVKDHMNFYEWCDLTKKVYLIVLVLIHIYVFKFPAL